MVPRQLQQKQNQQLMQHETWNIPEIVQNKTFGAGPSPHKKIQNMRREQNNYEVHFNYVTLSKLFRIIILKENILAIARLTQNLVDFSWLAQ